MLGLIVMMLACGDKGACTEMGCMSGLTVSFLGPDSEPVNNVQGTITIGGSSISFNCTEEGEEYTCQDNEVFFFVEEGDSLSYNVSMEGPYMGQGDVSVSWEEYTPNGEECPPVCYDASVEVYLDRSVEPQ